MKFICNVSKIINFLRIFDEHHFRNPLIEIIDACISIYFIVYKSSCKQNANTMNFS